MIKIKDIVENNKYELVTLVKRVWQGVANNNNTYLNLFLQDNSGMINARLWDAKEEDIQALKLGKVVKFEVNSLRYNNDLQLKINHYQVLSDKEAEQYYQDLILSAPIKIEKEWKDIIHTVESFADPILKKIVLYLLKKYQEEFTIRPAAVRVHHSVRSGLLWHTATMLKVAKELVKIYHDRDINQDLLYAGIIMHDFGKIWELGPQLVTSFTFQGAMVGHIVIGSEQIKVACHDLKINDQDSSVILLQHMILASHGKHDFGSPVLPKTMEAELVHQIDNLDAKITIIDENLKEINPGEMTSRLVVLEGRNFYKPPKKQPK
ncbi:MAG: HD domain-containing protein [Spiroplasma sp.]|nr:HD domain-containing protein [Spiroplasma sp.]